MGVRKIKSIGGKVKNFISRKIVRGEYILKDTSGMTVIELLLILVVLIALVLIFKNQLISLVGTIFEKISSESAGI